MNMIKNDYRGFCLFNDIEDANLQTRNRAITLANLAEDHTKDRRINAKGASLILGYFNAIPAPERNTVRVAFADNMKQRGFALVA